MFGDYATTMRRKKIKGENGVLGRSDLELVKMITIGLVVITNAVAPLQDHLRCHLRGRLCHCHHYHYHRHRHHYKSNLNDTVNAGHSSQSAQAMVRVEGHLTDDQCSQSVDTKYKMSTTLTHFSLLSLGDRVSNWGGSEQAIRREKKNRKGLFTHMTAKSYISLTNDDELPLRPDRTSS